VALTKILYPTQPNSATLIQQANNSDYRPALAILKHNSLSNRITKLLSNRITKWEITITKCDYVSQKVDGALHSIYNIAECPLIPDRGG
jgi:hypothetical protein